MRSETVRATFTPPPAASAAAAKGMHMFSYTHDRYKHLTAVRELIILCVHLCHNLFTAGATATKGLDADLMSFLMDDSNFNSKKANS